MRQGFIRLALSPVIDGPSGMDVIATPYVILLKEMGDSLEQ